MEQTVYGDILFFVNFCMDFQCLFLTAKLLRRPFRLWRGALFAALGALYACVVLFLSISGVWAFLADCGVCLLMCIGVFWHREARPLQLLIPFALYFGVSFAVGGVISGMGALLSHIEAPVGVGEGELSSVGFFLLAMLGGLVTFLWGRLCQRRAKGKHVHLTLFWGERTITLEGLIDTANLLKDPVGGKAVVLLESDAAAELLPQELLEASLCADRTTVATLPTELARRVRWIPAQTATGKGLLMALDPDRALLDAGRGEIPVELLIAPMRLSQDLDGCRALLPASLITE